MENLGSHLSWPRKKKIDRRQLGCKTCVLRYIGVALCCKPKTGGRNDPLSFALDAAIPFVPWGRVSPVWLNLRSRFLLSKSASGDIEGRNDRGGALSCQKQNKSEWRGSLSLLKPSFSFGSLNVLCTQASGFGNNGVLHFYCPQNIFLWVRHKDLRAREGP